MTDHWPIPEWDDLDLVPTVIEAEVYDMLDFHGRPILFEDGTPQMRLVLEVWEKIPGGSKRMRHYIDLPNGGLKYE